MRSSCIQCQRMKKKCSRQLPKCALCLRHRRECSYDTLSTSSEGGDLSRSEGSQPLSSSQLSSSSSFPSVYFLDSALFWRSLNQLRDTDSDINASLLQSLGNVFVQDGIVSEYFTSVHPWLPFLSRRRFMERVMNPLAPTRPGNILLTAAVKLLANKPNEHGLRSTAYTSIKAAIHQLEASNLLDFGIFQALILVAVYEFGHAIYPAAYLTLGYCIRYGHALDIPKTVEQQTVDGTFDRMELEERRRSWWAVLVLDRNMHLGCIERPALVNDPSSKSVLPMEDSLWESADEVRAPLHLLSHSPTAAMGRFCLTAQASIFVGRVVRNIHESPEEDEFRNREAKILDNTIAALTNVCLEEGRFRGIGVCSPTTICYSARLLLHGKERLPIQSSLNAATFEIRQSKAIESEIAASMLKVAQALGVMGDCASQEASPFCSHAMYRAGLFYAREQRDLGEPLGSKAFEDIKLGLAVIGNRWKAADAYVEMLEARELTGIL